MEVENNTDIEHFKAFILFRFLSLRTLSIAII